MRFYESREIHMSEFPTGATREASSNMLAILEPGCQLSRKWWVAHYPWVTKKEKQAWPTTSRWGDHSTTYKHHTSQTRHVKEKGAFTNEQEDFLGKVKLLLLSPSYLFGSHLFLYLNSVAFAFISILSLYLNFGIIPLGIFIFYFLCSLEACKDFFFEHVQLWRKYVH